MDEPMKDMQSVTGRHGALKIGIAVLVLMAVTASIVWVGRHRIAVMAAPKKPASKSRTAAAVRVDELFWKTFHNGEYEKIQSVLDALTASYIRTPNDSVTAAHIAWLHNWRIAERSRLHSAPATITDDLVLALRYFQEAASLDPSDARYLGFLATSTLAEGHLHKDEKLTRKGYFLLLDSIKAWPEFNLFSGGYVMSRFPADSPQFRQGLEWQWRSLEKCTGEKIDRANPDYSIHMSKETREGRKRVCWNSWIAPHNFEGFFLNMGDMLVKAGDWQTARKIYANARLAREYPSWKYKGALEDRIKYAENNVAIFNSANETAEPKIMINSEFSCTGCHMK
jgi:hypothetical protein